MNGVFHLLNITSSFIFSFVFDVANDKVKLIQNKSLRLPRHNNSADLGQFVNAFLELEHKDLKLDEVQSYVICDSKIGLSNSEKFSVLDQSQLARTFSFTNNLVNSNDGAIRNGVLELNEHSSRFEFNETSDDSSTNLFHNEIDFRLSELVINDDPDLAVVRELWQDQKELITDMDKLVNFGLASPLNIEDSTIRFTYFYIYQHIFKKLFEGFAQDKYLSTNYQVLVTGILGSKLGSVDFIIQAITASTPFTGVYQLLIDDQNIVQTLTVLSKLTGVKIDYSLFLKRYQIISIDGPQKKHNDEDTLCKVIVNGDREVYPYENIIWGFEIDPLEEMHVLVDLNKDSIIFNNKGSQVMLCSTNGVYGVILDTTYKLPSTAKDLHSWYQKVSDNFKL